MATLRSELETENPLLQGAGMIFDLSGTGVLKNTFFRLKDLHADSEAIGEDFRDVLRAEWKLLNSKESDDGRH